MMCYEGLRFQESWSCIEFDELIEDSGSWSFNLSYVACVEGSVRLICLILRVCRGSGVAQLPGTSHPRWVR